MAKEVWVRGERRKFYKAESDMWQVIRNVLGSREQREVQVALHVLGESIGKLQAAECQLSPEEQLLARYYLDRIADLQAFSVRPTGAASRAGQRHSHRFRGGDAD